MNNKMQPKKRSLDEIAREKLKVESDGRRLLMKEMDGLPNADPEFTRNTIYEVKSKVVLPVAKYYIDFDILITPKGCLEIQPGTVMIFGPDAGIAAYGSFQARGSADKEIIFKAIDEKWKNISIIGESSQDSVLEQCMISGRTGCYYDTEYGKFRREGKHFNSGGSLAVLNSKCRVGNCLFYKNYPNAEPSYPRCALSGGGPMIGGGIYSKESEVTVEESIFLENMAQRGGGIFSDGGLIVLKNNFLKENFADTGGGVCCLGDIECADNTFNGNRACGSGGGLYLGRHGKWNVERNTFEDNIALSQGGAIARAGNLTAKENTFTNNLPEDINELR